MRCEKISGLATLPAQPAGGSPTNLMETDLMAEEPPPEDFNPWYAKAHPPRYPTAPVMVSKKTLAYLAEEIAVAAMKVTDGRGLLRKAVTQGDWIDLQNVALDALSKWLRCEVRVGGMKYGPETETVEAFVRHLQRMTPEQLVAASETAWVAASDAAVDAAWDTASDAAVGAAVDAVGVAAWVAAGEAAEESAGEAARDAAGEIQGAALMRERGKPFFFLPMFGFADPEAVLAADKAPPCGE